MKILVYKDIESKFLLFLLIERSICNLYLQFGSTLFRVSTFQLGIRRLQVMLNTNYGSCLLYTSPSPRDISGSRMPSSA